MKKKKMTADQILDNLHVPEPTWDTVADRDVSRHPNGQYVAGQPNLITRNPHRRLSSWFIKALERIPIDQPAAIQRIYNRLVSIAEGGDPKASVWAINVLLSRAYGKVPQDLETLDAMKKMGVNIQVVNLRPLPQGTPEPIQRQLPEPNFDVDAELLD